MSDKKNKDFNYDELKLKKQTDLTAEEKDFLAKEDEKIKKEKEKEIKDNTEMSLKQIRSSTGLYEFTFNVDHGNYEKGDKVNYHLSTCKALEAHKIGTTGKKITVIEKASKDKVN